MRWLGRAAMAAVLLTGCRDDSGGEDGGGTDTEIAREPASPPIFLQPASGVLMLTTDRVEDVELRIADVSAGSTRFVLDGVGYGDLTATPWLGTLEADRLLLHTRGGLLSARHSFYLETPSVDEPARSAEIQVNVLVDAVPPIAASLGNASTRSGTAVMAQGMGDESLLLVYDDTQESGPEVTAYRSQGTGWDLETSVTVPTPRLDRIDGALPLSGSLVTGGTPDVGDDRLRLAWRRTGEIVEFVDRPWTGSASVRRTALALDQLDVETFEFASLGRPMVVGDAILVETNLLTDTESPRPGDRRLVTVPLTGAPAEAGAARLSAPLGVVDIDRLGPVIDFAGAELEPDVRPRLVAARVGGARAAVLEVDPDNGTLRLRGMSEELGGWQDSPFSLSATIGAFGSRTMLGVAGGQAVVQAFDDSGETAAEDASTSLIGGGSQQTAGSPAITMLAGHPVMLIPMGPEHPAQALTVAGARVNSQVLDLLRCEEIALPAVRDGLVGMSVQFACRGGDEIRFGTVALTP